MKSVSILNRGRLQDAVLAARQQARVDACSVNALDDPLPLRHDRELSPGARPALEASANALPAGQIVPGPPDRLEVFLVESLARLPLTGLPLR